MQIYQNLSDRDKGIVLILAGLVLLLHTIGFMERGLGYLITFGALYTIWCGFSKMGGPQIVRNLLQGRQQK